MTVADEIARDLAMFSNVEEGAPAGGRIWTVENHTVVAGRGTSLEREVNIGYCRSCGIEIVRRPSGGGAVVVGPGTLQWALALPYHLAPELQSISEAKRWANELVIAALSVGQLRAHESGDLVLGDRKAGGLALKRGRCAVLVHGTVLCTADLDTIAAALAHPPREPGYRRGRSHREFLVNLGRIDAGAVQRALRDSLLALGAFPAGH